MSDDRTTTSARDLPPETRTIVDTFYRAFAGEPDLLDRVVTPDWQDLPLAPGQAPGPEGIKPMIAGLKQAIPDLAIAVHDVMVDGDRIGVRAAMTGTHTGEWFGVPATGKAFSVTLHEFHRLDNGRIAQTYHLEDWFGWLNQVGAWPASKENAA